MEYSYKVVIHVFVDVALLTGGGLAMQGKVSNRNDPYSSREGHHQLRILLFHIMWTLNSYAIVLFHLFLFTVFTHRLQIHMPLPLSAPDPVGL